MRLSFVTISLALALLAGPAHAAEPNGEWLVADRVAQIRIDNCDGALWGVVSWEKKPGGRDIENPDPAKRSRPTLGMPILLNMKQTRPDRWEGEVYNAQNGKTYDASITLLDPNTLRIQGCILGFLCGGENWTRVATEPSQARSGQKATTGRNATAPGKPPETIDVCSSVVGLSGRTH